MQTYNPLKVKFSPSELRHFGQLVANIAHTAQSWQVPELDLAATVLADWLRRNRARLAFGEPGRYSFSPAEAHALRIAFDHLPTHGFPQLHTLLIDYTFRDSRARQQFYTQTQHGQEL